MELLRRPNVSYLELMSIAECGNSNINQGKLEEGEKQTPTTTIDEPNKSK